MMERRQDAILGLVFAAFGLLAAVKADAYSGITGGYPMVLGLVIAFLGALIAGKALFNGRALPRPLVEHKRRLALSLAIAAAYLAAIPAIGFYTASLGVMLILPIALGFRRPTYLAMMATVFIAVNWLVFSVALEKPLPPEFWMPY
jgi:putative tricarboxylic transport membrane protein